MLIRTWLKWLIIFVILLIGVESAVRFAGESYFYVDEIDISGDYDILEKDVNEVLENIKGKNIWKIDEKKISKYMKQDVRIKDIDIRKIIPNRLKINIQERIAYAYVIIDSNIYIMDKTGVIFGYANEQRKDLIYIDINDKEELEKVLTILNILSKDIKDNVSNIYIKDEIIKIIFKNNLLVKTDTDVEQEKYNIVYNLYEKLQNEDKKVEYIDIRFKDYIVK